jgi:hypothetical protein
MKDKRNAGRLLVGKTEGKRPLGGLRHRWVDDIKMDLRDIRWSGIDWNDLAKNMDHCRVLMNTVINLGVS